MSDPGIQTKGATQRPAPPDSPKGTYRGIGGFTGKPGLPPRPVPTTPNAPPQSADRKTNASPQRSFASGCLMTIAVGGVLMLLGGIGIYLYGGPWFSGRMANAALNMSHDLNLSVSGQTIVTEEIKELKEQDPPFMEMVMVVAEFQNGTLAPLLVVYGVGIDNIENAPITVDQKARGVLAAKRFILGVRNEKINRDTLYQVIEEISYPAGYGGKLRAMNTQITEREMLDFIGAMEAAADEAGVDASGPANFHFDQIVADIIDEARMRTIEEIPR